ncbi:hypothetical protein N0V93_006553 [Gnomoniopsis smithogilvyi]|uniref:Ubiquitin-like protease family profile domain-containing protein n=1 Tax=Gnomoniopsis smithogilvyi TaxID=1191159 RepID=A0A9W9CVQ1_9PEZI|nr:hypothetical protein N0V93_006553 [Gnomoniopsis smithogilvyi]
MDQSADSASKRNTNHQGSQSLRSTENRHSISAIDEYRSTSTHSGLHASRKRSRHMKKGQVTAIGSPEQEPDKPTSHELATQPRFKTPGRPLISQSEQSNDRIEDDGLEVLHGESRSGTANAHGEAQYKKSVFALIPDASSDDELNEVAPPPSKTKMRDRMNQATRPNERRGNQANNGLKRSAGSPDVLHGEHPTKRRHEPSSEANIPRTKFSAPTMGNSRGRPGAFRVIQAVCEPSFIYCPADNVPCFLLTNDKDRQHFIVADNKGAELESLGWITPNLERVQVIYHHSESSILKITSATGIDRNSRFSKGAATLVEFESVREANNWVKLCHRANISIRLQIEDRTKLRMTMNEKIKRIREWNMKQPAPLPQDMQLAAHQAENRPRVRQNIEPSSSEIRRSGSAAGPKRLQAHMRADDDQDSKALNVREPTHSEELRYHENIHPEQAQRSSRRPQENQRNLRSVKSKAPSPIPLPPERWTEQNPDWVEKRSYNIPLIYERTTISATDIERLDEGQFLNDEIISFYAKYLHKELETRNEQVAKKVYVFSSFFWEKLRSSGYDGVKGWTTKVDVSSFDYIVVPINQSAHWYLAIICNPWALLPKENTGEDCDAVHSAAAGENFQEQASVEGETGAKMETVTSSLAHISFDEQQIDGTAAIDLENSKPMSSAKRSKLARKGPGPRKYHPKDPRVIVLDSLDGAHTNVATTLKTYLKNEIKQKKNVDIELPQQFGMAAKDIPFQDNFTDCGVYLLGYLEEFMKDPHEFTKKILQHESRDWDVNASAMRTRIREVIFDLQNKYCKELKRQKREKKVASMQKKAKSLTPPAVLQASSLQLASQLAERSSETGSSVANTRQRIPAHALSSPVRQPEAAQVSEQRSATVSPPPSQRKKAGSRQAVVALDPVKPPGQSSGSDPRTADVDEREDVASMQQVHNSPTQTVTKESPDLDTISSSGSSLEALNTDASMIVHLSQSTESKEPIHSQPEEQIVSGQTAAKPSRKIKSSAASTGRSENANVARKIGRPITSSESQEAQSTAVQDLTPRPSKPADPIDFSEKSQPKKSTTSGSTPPQTTPRPPETRIMLDGNYDVRLFLEPIPSSPPSATPMPLSGTSRTFSKGRRDRSEALSIENTAKHSTSRQNGERSRYWPSPPEASVTQATSSRQTVVPSPSNDGTVAQGRTTSKEEGKRGRKSHEERRALRKVKNDDDDKRSSSSPTIDLTVD